MSKKLLIEKVNALLLLTLYGHSSFSHIYKPVILCCSLEHPGEAGLSGEKHAGQASFRPFHYSETRSLVHRTVD